jgi:flagellar basal body P-ring protein FlgI
MRLLVNFAFCFWFSGLASLAHADRIKDLASLAGVRNNQLVGYGLVVGLSGTGDAIWGSPCNLCRPCCRVLACQRIPPVCRVPTQQR